MQMSWELVKAGTNQLGAPNSPAVRYGDETLFAAEVESLIHAHFQNKYQKKLLFLKGIMKLLFASLSDLNVLC